MLKLKIKTSECKLPTLYVPFMFFGWYIKFKMKDKKLFKAYKFAKKELKKCHHLTLVEVETKNEHIKIEVV